MTEPRNPGEALTGAAQRIAAQRQATRDLSEDIARQRQAQTETVQQSTPGTQS